MGLYGNDPIVFGACSVQFSLNMCIKEALAQQHLI